VISHDGFPMNRGARQTRKTTVFETHASSQVPMDPEEARAKTAPPPLQLPRRKRLAQEVAQPGRSEYLSARRGIAAEVFHRSRHDQPLSVKSLARDLAGFSDQRR
jgi:hypothetical protein